MIYEYEKEAQLLYNNLMIANLYNVIYSSDKFQNFKNQTQVFVDKHLNPYNFII